MIGSWFPGFLIIIFLFFMYGKFVMNSVTRYVLSIRQLKFSLPDILIKKVLIAIKETTIRKPGMQENNNKAYSY